MKFHILALFICLFLSVPLISARPKPTEDLILKKQMHQHDPPHQQHSWDHLVGKHSGEAVETIQKERPDVKVVTVPQDAMMTMDFRMDRVRVFVDENGNVVRPPVVG